MLMLMLMLMLMIMAMMLMMLRQGLLQRGGRGVVVPGGCGVAGGCLLFLFLKYRKATNLSNNVNLQAAYLKEEEYNLDLTISKLAVPYVAIMDGITMGGGCGISVNGRYVLQEKGLGQNL